MRRPGATRLLLCSVLLSAGCRAPMAPITPGAVRFVRGEPEERKRDPSDFAGTVSASIAAQARLTPDLALGYGSDKALTVWLAERYELSAIWGNWLLGLEGYLVLLRGESARLGLLHGIAGSLLLEAGTIDELPKLIEPTVLLDPTAGLFAEVNALKGTLFAAARYTHALELVTGAVSRPRHHVSAALGYQFRVGRLRISPELIVIRSWWRRSDKLPPAWFVEPGIGAAVMF